MPRKSEWFHRLDEILEALRGVPHEVLDRKDAEALFQVSSRQATRILHRLGAAQTGGALVIGREELLARLTQLGEDEQVVFEVRRRERLRDELDQLRRQSRSRRILIRPPAAVHEWRALPQEIRLESGVLHVRFSTPVELLERLVLLAQTIAEDWEAFESEATGKARAVS